MGNEQTKSGVATGFGIQSMDEQLQKRFSRGIQFNMKIVIKGDRNSGKTSLFQRLQGKPFAESYTPTDEIQVCSILWSYKETQDTVKVEVWDVVDKGKTQKKKKGFGRLKLFNNTQEEDPTNQPLDAQFLDVYQGTHGVIFTYDMTKQWTFQYVLRELPQVPYHIPVVVLGNFRDMGEHRVVTSLEAISHIEVLERPEGSADVRYCEASMKDGFGLKYLHKFFSIPFLHLQQETLLRQLQVNRELIQSALEDLAINENSEDQNYDLFKEAVAMRAQEKQRKMAEAKAATDSLTSTNQLPKDGGTAGPVVGRQNLAPAEPVVAVPTDQPDHGSEVRRSSFRERLSQKFSTKKASPATTRQEQHSAVVTGSPSTTGAVGVDNFVPEDQIDSAFLGEEESEDHKLLDDPSDSDESDGNPLVAADEDISSGQEEVDGLNTTAITSGRPAEKQEEVSLPVDDDKEEEEEHNFQDIKEEEEKQVVPSTPPKPPAAKRTALVSAKSVELTESSSEDHAEEEELVHSKKKKASTTAVSRPSVAKESPPSQRKSSGLMLEHSSTSSKKKASSSGLKLSETKDDEYSLPTAKEAEKKSKSKKKKRHKESEVEAVVVGRKQPTSLPVASGDPFSSSLLDAWLDSPGSDPLAPVLQPVTPPAAIATEEQPPTEEKKRHKHKKHKHRSDAASSGGKKKHKQRDLSSEANEELPGNDYVALL